MLSSEELATAGAITSATAVSYDSSAKPTLVDDVRRLWSYRRLITLMARRQLGLRYQRSVLGIWWTLLSPILETGVLWLVFSHIFRFSTTNAPYIVYLLSGLVPVFMFRNSVMAVASSMGVGSTVLSRVRLPGEAFAVATVIDTFVSSAMMLVPLAIIMLAVGPGFSPTCALVFIPLLLLVFFALGVGMVLAPLATRFPDIVVLTGVVLTLLYYLSAVFYPVSILSGRLRDIVHLNPLFDFIETFRSMLYAHSVGSAGDYLGMLAAVSIALGLGVLVVRRTRTFVLESL